MGTGVSNLLPIALAILLGHFMVDLFLSGSFLTRVFLLGRFLLGYFLLGRFLLGYFFTGHFIGSYLTGTFFYWVIFIIIFLFESHH